MRLFNTIISSFQFSLSVVSNSLRLHGLQHTRAPCPSPTPSIYANSCPLTRWCNPTLSSSVIPFSSHLQSFPGSDSFQMNQFFASGGKSIRVSPVASVLTMNRSDQSLSRVQLFATSWITARQVSLSISNSQSSPRRMSIESVMPSSHLILCRPFLLLPPILPSIRVFSNESTLHMRWPKYWSFSFSVISSKESPGLISFRMDWLDLPAVQGTCKSLLQHHSSKASILWHSAFFTVPLSHPYMTTGKP